MASRRISIKNSPNSALLTSEGVAEYLSISTSKADKLIYTGIIPSIKLDGNRRIRRADLEAYIAQFTPEAGRTVA